MWPNLAAAVVITTWIHFKNKAQTDVLLESHKLLRQDMSDVVTTLAALPAKEVPKDLGTGLDTEHASE